MAKETIKVSKDTKHIQIVPPKLVFIYELLRRAINFFIGVYISYYLFDNCLFCKDCNSAVIIYMALLSLICFINCGIPVNKLIKINSLGG